MVFRKRSTTVSTCNSNFLDIMRTPYLQLFTFPHILPFQPTAIAFNSPSLKERLL